MKEKLRDLIHSKIDDRGFDKTRINSYSLNRKSNGIYQMIIFFGGRQTKNGDKRHPDIPIGKDKEVAYAVAEIVDDIMVENEEVDITKGLVMTNKEEGGSGW